MILFRSSLAPCGLIILLLAAMPATAQVIERVSLASSEASSYSGPGMSISANGRFVAFTSLASDLVPGDTNGKKDVFVRDRLIGVTTRVSVSSLGAEGNLPSGADSMSADGRFVTFSSLASNLVAGDTNGQNDVFVHDRRTGVTSRVSIDVTGVQGNGPSSGSSLSADGRYVAFESAASNLVANDNNGARDIFVHDRQTAVVSRVSVHTSGAEAGGDSLSASISADGRSVAFGSSATNLVPGDTNKMHDIFVHHLPTGTTTRVSVDSSGTEAGPGPLGSYTPTISADGRFVAFSSYATNLVVGDTNGQTDIFVHDRQTGTTSRVSVGSAGTEANEKSETPSISGDGQLVTFESRASNLVPGDTNFKQDIFVRDRQSATTRRVSVDSANGEGDGWNHSSSISADGQLVGFSSNATDLVPDDTNGHDDAFIHDLETGQTTRESVASAGAEGNGASRFGSLSGDGRFVAFQSEATNLVPGDTNGYADIFVHDREGGGTTTRVSVDSSGVEANAASAEPVISANGRFVAFWSDASNLVPGDVNLTDIFTHDRELELTSLVTVSSSGVQANGSSLRPSISGDGRYVAFESLANNLVTGDTNGRRDIFVRYLQNGSSLRVSVDSGGVQGNHNSFAASVSEDGRFVAFESAASNLVPGDTNARRDIFVHDLQTAATSRVSLDSSGAQADSHSFAPSTSADGRFVAFMSSATNLVAGDGNGVDDIFVHDRQTGATSRVSIDSAGLQGNGHSRWPWISGEGRFVGFESEAFNLVPNDQNGAIDVFVHDRWTGTTARVSVDEAAGEVAGPCSTARLSSDGAFVAFMSSDAGLVPGDTNGVTDVFVRDLRFALGFSGVPKHPNPAHFTFVNAWGEAGNKATVLISCTGTSPGTPLPGDPRTVPITSDACTSLGLQLSVLLQGTIDATGGGTTPVIAFPAVNPGLTIYAAAITTDAAGGGFVSVSDPIVFVTE